MKVEVRKRVIPVDEPTRRGFNLGLRVAATLLIDAAEDMEQQAMQYRSTKRQAGTALDRRLRADAIMLDAQARLLRTQAQVIRSTTPEQVREHRR